MKKNNSGRKRLRLSARDLLITFYIFAATFLACFLLRFLDGGATCVPMVFMLSVFLISRMTEGYLYGTVASVVSVFAVNYVFTYPYMAFNFTLSGYPMTFVTMMIVSVITSTMTSQLKEQESIRAEAENERIRGNLLRSVSHDLRTPLTAIIGSSEWLVENGEDSEWQENAMMIQGIEEDASWLLRMVENLLSITRLESNGAKLRLQPEMAEEIVGAAVAKFKKWHQGQPLDIIMDDGILMAEMDGTLIEQVIINFLDNAARHSGVVDLITLEVGREMDSIFFKVSDRGKGIPEGELGDIFSGMKHASAENPDKTRSMGIGLSVCRTIIKAHGGQVFAGNRPEGGAVFMFTLPAMEVDENVDQ